MKKLLAMMLALTLALGLTACGGGKAPAEPTTAPAEGTAEETTESEGEFTEEQVALAQDYSDMADAFNAIVDVINGDEELLADEELVSMMNDLAAQMTEIDGAFEDPANLTPEVMDSIRAYIEAGNTFVATVQAAMGEADEAAVDEITVPVMIQNETGVDIYALAISPANSDDWGENLIDGVIADGTTVSGNITFTADTLVWDILIADSEGTQCTFMGVDFSDASTEGATLLLSGTEDGDYYAEIVQ